jgi:hypothetical protein
MSKPVTQYELPEHFVDQFWRAVRHVGVTPRKNLEWFLEFGRQDLAHAEKGKLVEVWLDLNAMAIVAGIHKDRQLGLEAFEQQLHWKQVATYFPQLSDFREKISNLQGLVRRHVKAFIGTGHAIVRTSSLRFVVYRKDRSVRLIPELSRPDGPFLYRLMASLAASGMLLTTCGDSKCGKVFVKDRLNQKYCSLTCKGRLNMERKRERDKRKSQRRSIPRR